MAKIKSEVPAVLFDLDGTLIDSVYEHVEAWWTTLHRAGLLVPKWRIHRRVGMSGKSFVTELLREFAPNKKIDFDKLEEQHDAMIVEAISAVQPLPGTDELLEHLHRSKVRIAIATTGNRKQTALFLKKLTIPRGMPILTGDDVKKAKPSPDIFLAAAQSLKVQLRDCIVVGDSVWDLLAAGRKGALGVGMLSGGYGEEELHRAGAFRIYAILKTCYCIWNSSVFRGSDMESTRTPKPMAVHGERVVADTLTVILKHHGYDCTPPYNGYDFVTLTRQIRPQVILTDVVMLGMYGTEAAMLILDEQPECKIIFLATSTGADTLCQAVKQRVMITVVFKHGEMLRCGVQSQKKVTGLQIRIYLIVRNIAQPFFLRTRILVLQCESRSTPLNHYLSS